MFEQFVLPAQGPDPRLKLVLGLLGLSFSLQKFFFGFREDGGILLDLLLQDGTLALKREGHLFKDLYVYKHLSIFLAKYK